MSGLRSVRSSTVRLCNPPHVHYMTFQRKPCSTHLVIFFIFVLHQVSAGVNTTSLEDANSTTASGFVSFAQVGMFSTSNDEPHHIISTKDETVFVGGTTAPLERGAESDLGLPLTNGLKNEDAFIAKLDSTIRNSSAVKWIYRAGTSKEDRLHAMYIDDNGKYLYIAGRTFGVLPGTTYKGLSDLFIIKYDVTGNKPEEVWDQPLVLGTISSDAVLALEADPYDQDVIYATGFTSGNLFPGRRSNGTDDVSDAILFSFSASNAAVRHSVQFGTGFGDHGTGIVVSEDPDGPIFVSAITDRRIGQYNFGNFHLYKFTRDLTPLGDMLLKTFSREDVVGFEKHPLLKDSLIAAGTSWLDSRNGNDVFVKRVVRTFDVKNINTTAVDIDDVGYDEFTKRLGSSDGSHDYTTGMLIDGDSGRLIISGHTVGAFAPGSSDRGERAPFIASIDPNDGSLTDVAQMEVETEQSWVELSGISMMPEKDGVYYAFKVSNETSRQFYVMIGTFLFPGAWKERIEVKEKPSPSPKAVIEKASEEKSIPLAVIVGGACGGFACLLFVLGWIAGMRIRKRSKVAQVFDKTLVQRPSFMNPGRTRPGPMLGPKIKGRNSSGLI